MAKIMWFCGVLLVAGVASAYLEAVAASIVGGQEDVSSSEKPNDSSPRHQRFVPQVAFQCGFQSQYLDKSGQWVTDKNSTDCLTAKLDILHYCRNVYPDLQVTNIVESTHHTQLVNWCKPEGEPCKWKFWVKPYRCIVGEFESDALLVPEGCHFSHVDDRAICDSFQRWNRTASDRCKSQNMQVRSFSILEPCGIALFSGVEYVCCPETGKDSVISATTTIEPIMHVEALLRKAKTKGDAKNLPKKDEDWWKNREDDNDDDDDDDEDDVSDKDEDDDNDSDEDEDDRMIEDTLKSGKGDDPYFRSADPDNEHDLYKEAMGRLQAKHQSKVAKVMKDWADLETRYQEKKQKDPTGAESFRKDMIDRFQKTVQALEDENKEERRRLGEVHQQRIIAVVNEQKREAIKQYRDALGEKTPNSHRILRSLQHYIRFEEKDRTHTINYYRHLLKSDPELAKDYREHVTNKLQDIDLRINGTIDMLRDVPQLAGKVKPVALEFWQTYRRDNTPTEVADDLIWIGANNGDELLKVYEEQAAKEHKEEVEKDPPKMSDKTSAQGLQNIAPSVKLEKLKESASELIQKIDVIPDPGSFDPETLEDEHHLPEVHQAHAKVETLHHETVVREQGVEISSRASPGLVVLGVLAAVMVLGMTLIGWAVFRRRNTTRYIEVDACTPEEKHVAGMQINGYENPTYKHFDASA